MSRQRAPKAGGQCAGDARLSDPGSALAAAPTRRDLIVQRALAASPTRRDFLVTGALAAGALWAGALAPGSARAAVTGAAGETGATGSPGVATVSSAAGVARAVRVAGAVVGLATDPRRPAERTVDQALVASLLDSALARALGTSSGLEALRSLVRPSDTVGLKINCLAGRGLSTHVELVTALIALLVKVGVPTSQIIVWDRADRDLVRARYAIVRGGLGPYFYGTNDDFENEPIEAGSVAGCLSKILTRKVSVVINLPVLKDHDLAGISGTLKSFYGAIHNPNKYHDHGCSPYIADLNAHPLVRGKLRLTVFDALTPQCEGGPAFVPEYAWPRGLVFATTDPVAADAVAYRLIAEQRRAVGLESLAKAERAPLWLALAALRGLGVADPALIREVGV